MIDPERLDLESASSAYRRRNCRGSPNLVRALRLAGKLRRRPDRDADFGARVHQAWCGQEVSLSPSERDTLMSLERMEKMLVADWASGAQVTLLGREQRLWLHERLAPIHSGAFDVAYGTVDSGLARMLIIDGKTLYGEFSPAANNDQLRELVGLARANFPRCKEFTVAILQPQKSIRPSVALYDETEAELALRELRSNIAQCADPDAPRSAGIWCNHCPAFEYCDEPRRLELKTRDLAQEIAEGAFNLPIGSEGARLLDAVKLAQGYLKAVCERYKELLAAEPDCVPGWHLRDGKRFRTIKDVAAAFEVASSLMSATEFLGAVSVNLKALEARCSAPAGGLHGRALTDFFNARFAQVLSTEVRAPELSRENSPTLKN